MKPLLRTVALLSSLTLSQFILPIAQYNPTPTTSVYAEESTLPRNHAQTVIDSLAAMYPEDTLPTHLLTSTMPEYITAATTGTTDQANFNIYYYVETTPIDINDPAVNQLNPIASMSKTTYASEEAAAEAVNQVLDL